MTIDAYTVSQFIVLVCIVSYIFFSATETAIISGDTLFLENLARKGNSKAVKVLHLIQEPDTALAMTLIGSNIASMASAAFITFIASKAYIMNDTNLFLLAAVQTIVFLMVCELLPKILSRSNPERFLLMSYWLIHFFVIIFRPLIYSTLAISNFVKRGLSINDSKPMVIDSREEIDALFKAVEKEGIIDSRHYIYFNEILSFRDVRANEVMTPLIDIISIEKNQSIRHCITLIEKTRFSRIPVFEERVDNIIGFIYYKDILKNGLVSNLEQIMRPPYFVPETKKIYELIKDMEDNEVDMIFAVNEYGAVEGLLTDEDIAEEIVGEIQTRDHPQEDLIKEIGPWRYSVAGNLDIEFFQRRFGIKIDKHEFVTVAGFLLYILGYIPKTGEKFNYQNVVFQIEEATDRSIERVIVAIPQNKSSILQA